MKRALLLSSVMLRGYGVSVVAQELAKKSEQHGWKIVIGCLQNDDDFSSEDCVVLPASTQLILDFCRKHKIDVVIAQTSPYFEVLPSISEYYPTIAYEHGDPTPSFFDQDASEREHIRQNKIVNVYPRVNRVIAVSFFLRNDIEWAQTKVCYSGCNHVRHGNFEKSTPAVTSAKFKVGTLMRLGAGEARYKGNEIYLEVIQRLQNQIDVEPWIMGRGTAEDKAFWNSHGVDVMLNATDLEREDYLSGLDVFVSASQWEGFNLPLVEAQALGTVGVAFDVGAHPETTPFLATSIEDLVSMLLAWSRDREILKRVSDQAQKYVQSKFDWNETAACFCQHLDEVAAEKNQDSKAGLILRKLWALYRREGLFGTVRRLTQKLFVVVKR